jgi:hypothetical protein
MERKSSAMKLVSSAVQPQNGSKPCAVKLERMMSPPSVRRTTSATSSSSPRQSKKMRTSNNNVEQNSVVGKIPAVKFGDLKPSHEHVVNYASLKVKQNSNNGETKPKIISLKGSSNKQSMLLPESVQMSSAALLEACEALGTNDGNISTSIYPGKSIPPENPATPLTKTELTPPTASIYINTPEEAFSPQLLVSITLLVIQ